MDLPRYLLSLPPGRACLRAPPTASAATSGRTCTESSSRFVERGERERERERGKTSDYTNI